jgi:N-carbamoylputrescine amidase
MSMTRLNSGSFTIGLVQMAVASDVRQNLPHALAKVEEAARQGAEVICLPELFRSQYFCQEENVALFEMAESIPGPSTEAFAKLAKKRKVAVIVPVFERRAPGLYHNSAAIIDADGSLKGLYRKMHIPDDPGYYEKFYFTPGDLGFRAFDVKAGRISTLICWDPWYPEGARLSALQGALALFYPTAIGWHPGEKERYGAAQRDAWQTVQRGHAVANGIYVAAVNRVGFEQTTKGSAGIEFWGSSFIADPQGVVLAEAPVDKEAILLAEVNPVHLEDIRRNWPFLRDRRIDAYGGMTSRFIDGAPGEPHGGK